MLNTIESPDLETWLITLFVLAVLYYITPGIINVFAYLMIVLFKVSIIIFSITLLMMIFTSFAH